MGWKRQKIKRKRTGGENKNMQKGRGLHNKMNKITSRCREYRCRDEVEHVRKNRQKGKKRIKVKMKNVKNNDKIKFFLLKTKKKFQKILT